MMIDQIWARQVLDSRGNPTVEVDMQLSDGSRGSAIVPSGASTGSHEALELRDNDPHLYAGKSVHTAIRHIHEILAPALKGKDAVDQSSLDQFMQKIDGTPNFSHIGANAVLGVSLAAARAASESRKIPLFQHFADLAGKTSPTLLPTPLINVINGGAHADNPLEVQEFLVIPEGAMSFSEGLRMGAEIFHILKKILKQQGEVTAVGDEGGFAPQCTSTDHALDVLVTAIAEAGYQGKVSLGLDVAASEFFRDGYYDFEGSSKTVAEMTDFFSHLQKKYPLVSLEDPLSEDDWDGFAHLVKKMGDTTQIVGDDLLVTNPQRIQKAQDQKSANAVLIKMNQIGTISETIRAVKMAQEAGWNTIISHRSGESEDTSIADLAVGLGAGQIKTGSLCRSERVAKYNRLLRIEEMLGEKAVYQGFLRK